MTPAKTIKKESSLETRSFDDFAIFNDPDYRDGIQGLGTLQPLYDERDDLAYLAIRESDLKGCKWTAKENDFEEDTVLLNRTHIFRGGVRETMHCFTAPRLQIIHASGILVIDNSITDKKGKTMNITVGDLSMEPINEAFYAEQKLAEKEKRQSKYSTRRKYLVNILTKDNKAAHGVPIVLTLSSSASRSISDALTKFYKDMDKCMSMAQDLGAAAKFDNRTHAVYVFSPRFEIKRDENKLTKQTFCFTGVASVISPEYNDKESAQQEIKKLCLQTQDWEKAWQDQKDKMLADFINRHSAQEAAKLAGAYGIAEGVPALMPQGSVQVLPTTTDLGPRDQDTGEINLTDSD